ncbi:TetR family transcriptional regulator [Stackebrandtia albiflava]|uniref:TetR family transcriptional regulator n=1 Tax=Stackebrandtia albiflava TaxID=406432 RepID=A0A562V3S9_9ACTN|nr:TetR family transcriptional regulator [Stackebrandtia albiflava]
MPAESNTRSRTRRAILDAAVAVLARDSTASVGDIAVAAGVGRTTVHRYFAERSDLINAIAADLLEKVHNAVDRARIDEGSAVEALGRVCQEWFALSDGFMLLFNNPELINDPAWSEDTESDLKILELIRRGIRDGEIDGSMTAEWVSNLLWSMLYAGWEYRRSHGASSHEALTQCLASLRKAISP